MECKKLRKENLFCYDAELNECQKDFASNEDYNYYCLNCTGTDEDTEEEEIKH